MAKSWNEMNQAERTGLAESMLGASFGHTAAIIAQAYLEASAEIARQAAVIERLGDDIVFDGIGNSRRDWIARDRMARIQYAKDNQSKTGG